VVKHSKQLAIPDHHNFYCRNLLAKIPGRWRKE
jgi:hypothetical protein